MSARRQATDGEGEAGPLRGTGFLVASGFLALVVVGVVVTLFISRTHDGAAGPTPGTSAPAGATPSLGAGSACHPSDTDQTIPQTTPTGVTWSLFHSIAIPASTTAGPLLTDAGVAHCYAHTPLGALIAYEQISVRAQFGPDWKAIIERQMIPGPDRNAFERNRARFVPSDQPGTYMQDAGFRFATYSPQTAVIQFASRASDGGLWTTTATVVWDAGDWKVQLVPGGNNGTPVQEIQSLAGFVPWGGT